MIGCGNVSAQYLPNGPRLDALRFVACADVDAAAADRVAAEHGLEACAPEDLPARADVDVVLCLTPPDTHADVALQAIAAGQARVHREAAGHERRARAAGARRGGGRRRARRLRAGHVPRRRASRRSRRRSTPARSARRRSRRCGCSPAPPETWHPSPAFLYADLAGPLLDIGPYGVTTAVELVGPVRRVTALAAAAARDRPDRRGPLAGTDFPIVEPTRVGAVLEHDGGVLTTLAASFDVDGAARHGIEVSGSDGTLVGGDPNTFDGPVVLRRARADDEPLELVSDWRHNARGLGLNDLCRAVRDGTPQRASGTLGLHVLEVLLAIRDSADNGAAIAIAAP